MPVLGKAKGWQAAFTHTGGCHLRPTVDTVLVPCPACWGQRRIFCYAQNGEGLIPRTCPACRGSGMWIERA